MNITLRQISYFVSTAQIGSVSGAAAALGISQSAITDSIKVLEDQTGATLFVRHARGVSLTYQGHQFLRHGQLVLEAVQDAGRAVRTQPEAISGQLNLGVTSLVTGYFLADLLARFRRIFPDIRVRVQEEERSYIEHLLFNGELHLALMQVSNLQDHAALAHDVLTRSRFRVWLPAKHRLLELQEIRMQDLLTEDLIVLSIDEMLLTMKAWWQAERIQPNIVLKTSSVEAVRSLVATGAGIAILPDIAYRPWSLEGDRVEARPISGINHAVDVGLAWRRGKSMFASADMFRALSHDYQHRYKLPD